MNRENYEPVSCDDHDLLEQASMHHARVVLEFDLDGVRQEASGTIGDVYTANGAEFVRFDAAGGPLDIQLDKIISLRSGSDA